MLWKPEMPSSGRGCLVRDGAPTPGHIPAEAVAHSGVSEDAPLQGRAWIRKNTKDPFLSEALRGQQGLSGCLPSRNLHLPSALTLFSPFLPS